ncbi:MAG: beta-propeller domain-containing protein [Nocardioides sp.]
MDGKQRAGVAAIIAAGIGLSFTAGLVVAGDDTGPGRPIAADQDPRQPVNRPIVLANADVSMTASCEDLLAFYVDRGVQRVTPWGWDSGVVYMEGDMSRESSGSSDAGAPAPAVPQVDRADSSGTGTNVQEAGVDEPDVVKTDGEILVRVQDDELTTYDVTGDEPVFLEAVDLPDLEGAEILLAGDTVVAVGRDQAVPEEGDGDGIVRGRWYGGYAEPVSRTRMVVIDVTDPAVPTITDTMVYDAALVTARQHGAVIRLTISAGLPDLDFVEPGTFRSDDSALERNREIVRASTLDDWLPSVTTDADGDSTTSPLLECSDVAMPDDDAGLGTLAVVGFDASTPDTWDATAVATDSQIVYVSADRLVLATNSWSGGGWGGCGIDQCGEPSFAGGTTRLYSFALTGNDATYVASGEVEGAVADRWAMDEADGVLRLAVGATAMTGNFNSVLTLQETGDDLVEIGRVDQLGVDEQIKSVRWFDDLAIVVTFRQTDPLYAVDLTDADSPELLGELKIPGYSEYLHPLGSWRMIGVGQAATADGMTMGAPTALFDVHDVTDPRQLDAVEYPKGSAALAGQDPRQFTWLPDQRTALTVVSEGMEGTTGSVSVLRVDGGRLTNRLVEVEYGTEVSQVRLVPLPTGRVVLVTGDTVSFFDLDA